MKEWNLEWCWSRKYDICKGFSDLSFLRNTNCSQLYKVLSDFRSKYYYSLQRKYVDAYWKMSCYYVIIYISIFVLQRSKDVLTHPKDNLSWHQSRDIPASSRLLTARVSDNKRNNSTIQLRLRNDYSASCRCVLKREFQSTLSIKFKNNSFTL